MSDHSTPLDVKKLGNEEKKATGKVATVVVRPSFHMFKGDKSLLVMIGSALFCISGFGFWMYVQFVLSP